MDKVAVILNLIIVALAGFSTFYSFKIWKRTNGRGMFWLFISLVYATLLRMIIFCCEDSMVVVISYLMVGFWVGLCYALYWIWKQTDEIVK